MNKDVVYKKEVDWSLFHYGFAIPAEYQVLFGRTEERFLQRGESKEITLYLNGTSYQAKLKNNRMDKKFEPHADIVQVRYGENSDFAKALRACFRRSYEYIRQIKMTREKGSKAHIILPNEYKEYLAIYPTEIKDMYMLETIEAEGMDALCKLVEGQSERILEAQFNFDMKDENAGFSENEQIVKIRRLNKSIGDQLKRLYGYRCQICGKLAGEEYGVTIVEAHHIDYFVRSLNNDASNQLIVCPNHHSIIHALDPEFDRKRLTYVYPNGKEEKLVLNRHL